MEKHVLKVSKIFLRKGHQVAVICEQHEKSLKALESYEGISIYRIPINSHNWFKKFTIWKWILSNNKLIAQADIIHCHDVFFWYLPFKLLYPFKKVYTTFHGYESFPVSQKAIIVRKFSEWLSNGNICIGDFIYKWYGTKPTYVSYGGINRIQNSEFRIQNFKNKNSALFIGRLDEQTGIKMYADAVKIIKDKIPEFEFVVIGDGEFGKQLSKNVKVLGSKSNPEEYFQKYHFAFVSRYLSILEAMIAKRLVFAVYNNAIKKDYLFMSPFSKFIVTANSPQELAKKVAYFFKNPHEKKKLIDAGFHWAKNQTWEKVAELYFKLWQ